jgi:choline dehydrogenase-like flavoprotein
VELIFSIMKMNNLNINVAVYASVERASTPYSRSGITAIGVIYCDQMGQYHCALVHKNGQVILSAGAIGSPQLLLLSGNRWLA